MSAVCKVCGGSGERSHEAILDCAAPGCNAAAERADLNEKLREHRRKHGAMSEYDLAWFCYQLGRNAK